MKSTSSKLLPKTRHGKAQLTKTRMNEVKRLAGMKILTRSSAWTLKTSLAYTKITKMGNTGGKQITWNIRDTFDSDHQRNESRKRAEGRSKGRVKD